MSLVKESAQAKIKHYFKVASYMSPRRRCRTRICEQKKITLLSSSDEEEIAVLQPKRLRKRFSAKKKLLSSDDSESEQSCGTTEVASSIQTTGEKRQPNENLESVPDSEELLPFKRSRTTRNCNRIVDSESLEESDSSVLSSDCEDDQLDIAEELKYIESYREPDPRLLYEDRVEKKKSKRNQASYDNDNDNQEVSIHKINLNHIKLLKKSAEDAIKFIVDLYNKDKENSGKGNTFRNREVCRYPVVKKEDEEHFKGDNFRVKVYVQKVSRKILLLNSYGITERATTIHSLIFHYRTNEVFAVTTNQAWNVVQWCSDFEFPGKIAARIFSTDGEFDTTNKGIVGTEAERKTTHKQLKKTNPYDLLTCCVRYKTEFRQNASILRLSCFQTKKLADKQESGEDDIEDDEEELVEEIEPTKSKSSAVKTPKVTVSLGNIRILKRFSTADILSILSVLSEIANGKDTIDLNGEIERNSSAHKKMLTAVHIEVASELNVCLSEIIHDAIADDNRMAELENFEFSHKHLSDFLSAFDFKLHYKDRIVKEFREIPTLKQIAAELRHELGNISEGTSRNDFLTRLNKAKISYVYGTNRDSKKPEKLLNFINGLLFHATDSCVYWHMNATWFHVQDTYLFLVDHQFKNLLTEYLLTEKRDPAYLNVRWSKDEKLGPESKLRKYLATYSESEYAWTSDRPEEDIVDMIRIGKDNHGNDVLFVYYFLPDLNKHVNMKCNRIVEALVQIGKAKMMRQTRNGQCNDVAGSEDVRKQLIDVYQKVSKKRFFRSNCSNFEKFLKMITEAKFYLAIGRDSTRCTSSLAKEKEMTGEIRVSNIADDLENLIDCKQNDDLKMLEDTARSFDQSFDKSCCSQLAETIHRELIEREYIEAEGDAIRGKLLSLSQNNFEISSNGKVNRFVYEKIISKFQPRACTTLSKLVFINMREKISKLIMTSFNLIEIPM